jgi:hypothetical protein
MFCMRRSQLQLVLLAIADLACYHYSVGDGCSGSHGAGQQSSKKQKQLHSQQNLLEVTWPTADELSAVE